MDTKKILKNLPKEFIKKYDLKIRIVNDKEVMTIYLNSMCFPLPTEITTNGTTYNFYHSTYYLTLWINIKNMHLSIFNNN